MRAELKTGELRAIVAGILGVDSNCITEEVGPATIDSWDSLAHLTIVTAVEESFGVQFSMEEIRRIDSFGSLEKALLAHLGS